MPTVKCIWCGVDHWVKPSVLARGSGEFCSKDCRNGYRKSDDVRFWRYVTVVTNSCWIWTGSVDKDGYGRILNNISAHRLSYEIHYGPIPEGLLIRHSCDNPPCVNPEHLSTGEAQDNSNDQKSRGRSTYGSRNGRSVLTPSDVLAIRDRILQGESIRNISKDFSQVGYTTVAVVARGESWTAL